MGSMGLTGGATHPGMDPPSIVALEMGGYNSVIQIAADYCARIFDSAAGFTRTFFASLTAAELHAILDSGTPLTSEILLRLRGASGVSSVQLETRLSLTSLHFANPDRLCCTFHGQVYVDTFYRHALADEKNLETIPSIAEALQQPPFASAGNINSSTSLPPVAELLDRLARQAQANGAAASSLLTSLAQAVIERPGILPPPARGEVIGTFDVELCCPYIIETNRELAHIDLVAQPNRSTLRISTSVERPALIDRLIGVRGSYLTDRLNSLTRVPLTPTLSLVGSNDRISRPAYDAPPVAPGILEFETLEAEATAVEAEGRQAIAVCCMVEASRYGIPGSVRHFIGEAEYGVRSDDALVRRVFMYKWRQGGFLRTIPLRRNITAQRRGRRPEDAILTGRIRLDTLDDVRLALNGATGIDNLQLWGRGTVTPERVIFPDEAFSVTDLPTEEYNVGPSSNRPWAISTTIDLAADFSDDPLIRQFQEAAFWDAYQHIERPFANLSPPPSPPRITLVSARLEAVRRNVEFIGRIPFVFF